MPKKGGRRKQLLHGDWLEPQLERVLLEVFGRFDADGDGALNKAELQAFAAACNDGETLPDDELEQIADYFEITEDGALTKGGFFQMMFMQTTSRPQDTWNDLKALGYDESLTLHNNQGHLSGSVVAVVANPATPETDVPDKPDDPDVPGRSPAPDTDEAQEELAAAATKKRQKNRAKKLRQKAKRTAASATAAAGHTEEQDSEQDPSTSGNEASTPEDAQTANSDTDAGAQRLVLGHWNTRTLAHDLRAMLVWGGVDFEDRRYEVGPPPRYDKSEWTDAKEDLGLAFPNLPFLLDRAEDVAITQHQTILRYLARKLRLEGQGDAAAMADMASEATRAWLDAFFSLTYSSYLDYSNSKKQYLIETLPYHATRFEAILLRQEQATDGHTAPVAFLCGSDEGALTYADFFLFEVLEQHRLWSDSCLDKFPALQRFAQRMGQLLHVKCWREGPQGDCTPPHNKYSQFYRSESDS